ncbi:hypothetical protein EDB83DRAFT_2503959 [Lactarius deliciosus]|nr:hypothetical protein EDB83DRAFT_2503959 [Lactarius deliciosus]
MSTLPSSSQQYGPNPTTPAFADDTDWFTAYLEIHALSEASWRYAYIFWLAIGSVTLTFTVLRLFALQSGRLGAYWSKWSLRRRTWRKKHSLAQARKSGQPHKQPRLLPSNVELLCLVSLITACLVATFVGPDYIAPTNDFVKRLMARDITAYKPQYTIQKAWWTSGGRAGLMSFALFPLCVLFALKRPPFAIFAISFLTDIHFDKLMWLHRWTGRFVWAMVTLHAALWSVQLANDTRSGTGKIAYVYAWQFPRFIYAWTAYILLTLLVLLSLGPIREKHYEIFYAFHVILVPSTIVMSALHHPPLWWWCWFALLLWAGERTLRATNWVYVNGYLGSPVHVPPTTSSGLRLSTRGQFMEMRSASPDQESIDFSIDNKHYAKNIHRDSLSMYHSPDSEHTHHSKHRSTSSTTSFLTPVLPTFSVPIGYGHAEVLAGRTIRLRLIPPGQLTWAPGQHFLLCIPSVSRLVSHPFTCASVCDEQKPGDDGRMITFLIRARNGWTKNLWTTVVSLLADGRRHPAQESPGTLPSSGVLLRTWVDGPFGSPVRTNWGLYSSAVIISGGSGVSFGISVLEFLCLCMAGRDGRYLGGKVGKVSAMRRIRFIWILRDFAHMQWCASVLHRCRSLVPRESLQLDLFVTNFNPSVPLGYNDIGNSTSPGDLDSITLPSVSEGHGVSFDEDGFIDDQVPDDFVDLSYYTGEYNETGELGHEEHRLDLTNFDGEHDDRMPGETSLNRTLKKEGTIRRALTRKARARRRGKPSLEEKPVLDSRRPPDSPMFNAETNYLLDSPVHPLRNSPGPSADTSAKRRSYLKPASLSLPSVPTTPWSPSLGDWDTPSPRDRLMDGSLDWDRKRVSSTFSQMSSSLQPLVREAPKGVELEVGDQEMRDVSIMTEFARPGRPKIDSILKDEAGRTSGRVVVACCGPATLNAVVRKAVAAQISPSRIRRGDYGGSIDLVVEDFSY